VTVFMVPPDHPDDWVLESRLSRMIAHRIAKKKYNIDPENFEWTYRLYGKGMRRPLYLIATFNPTEPTIRYPDGYGFLIPKGAELIFECHYTPIDEERLDRSKVALWFGEMPKDVKAKQIITRSAAHMDAIQLLPHKTLTLDRTLSFHADAKLFGLRPHMHQRGKWFQGILEYPDGTKKTILDVPRFDFEWQIYYTFQEPLLIPKGAKLHSIYHWDNTDWPGNPDPAAHVKFGQQITDEMSLSYPSYIYLNPAETDEAEQKMHDDMVEDDHKRAEAESDPAERP
jgi:hypothetical protein